MKKIFPIVIVLLFPVVMQGQLKPLSDQYILNPMTINPAFAGNRGALNIAAFYRQQWTGIEGAPRTLTLSADAPLLNRKMGLGFVIENDKIGVRNETFFNSVYSYKIDLLKGLLSFGLGAGIVTTNTKWSDLTTIDPGDELYMVDTKTFVVPDFSFGIYYSYNNYFAGFSIPRLVSYDFNYEESKYNLAADPGQYYYLFNTGYMIDLSENFNFFPSVLFYYSPRDKMLFDLNANIQLMNRIWLGTSYQSERAVTTFLQVDISEQLKTALTYSFILGELSSYSNGTYEVMLRYVFKYRADVVNPLEF